ncbi:flagellar biosynthesis protein FliQ [Fundidesulfovibrio terrae]|uniref:flagellar biosynthesis protein FliQ n=1 Tax=Fundidesulfovibrio terrae TaxID=2922866 RepID=UPI001FAED9F2|nr:flagellar biosynthesis protein FliQ [Fundidesulfovibrio terrae]
MTPEAVIGFARTAIETTLMLSLPLLGVSLVVGVVLSIVQAATQIQDPTLTFVPKIVVMFGAAIVAFPWLMDKMVGFTHDLIMNIPQYIQ